MLSTGDASEGWIPSKLFQYMGAGAEILGLVPEGDVAGILRETATGKVVAPNDVKAIASAVRSAYDRYCQGILHTQQSELARNYEAKHLTAQLVASLQFACECRFAPSAQWVNAS
jgi:hypothetical protein